MKRTRTAVPTLIAVLTLSLALFGCSTTRATATADNATPALTGMASSSSVSTSEAIATPVVTNYGGTAATTGTTATYGTANTATANFDPGVQSAASNAVAATDTSANVGMSSSTTTSDATSSTSSTTASDSGRRHRHRAMHKE